MKHAAGNGDGVGEVRHIRRGGRANLRGVVAGPQLPERVVAPAPHLPGLQQRTRVVDAEREANRAGDRQVDGAGPLGPCVVADLTRDVVAPTRDGVQAQRAGVNGASRDSQGVGRPIDRRREANHRFSRHGAVVMCVVSKLTEPIPSPALNLAVVADDARVRASSRDSTVVGAIAPARRTCVYNGGDQADESREHKRAANRPMRHDKPPVATPGAKSPRNGSRAVDGGEPREGRRAAGASSKLNELASSKPGSALRTAWVLNLPVAVFELKR